MPVYEYKALNEKGKKVSGIITAEGPTSARLKLSRDRIFPIEIREVRQTKKDTIIDSLTSRFAGLGRVNPAEVSASIRQLSTLIYSGLPLVDCLGALIEQTEQKQLKKIFIQIREKVVEGESLSKAMAEHPSVFSPIFVNMVRAAETGGALDLILKRLADFLEQRLKLKKKITSAMTYPIFMVMVSTVILVFLMSFVMPKVVGIFRGMELALPLSTRALIWITDMLRDYWWILLLVIGSLIVAISYWVKTDAGSTVWDRIRLSIPVAGKLHMKAVIARFTRTLAILLRSGLPLVQALETARLTAGNKLIEEAIRETAVKIGEGADFATPLQRTGRFPPLVVQLIRAGEQSGELEEMLEKAAEVYEDDVESSLSSLTSVLEPVIILVMGGVVGFIVMAILLPIFEMSGGIR